MPECVYRSTHPTVLEAVEARNGAYQRWIEEIDALSIEIFGEKTKWFSRGDWFAGFDHEPIEGWRPGSKDLAHLVVPDKRRKVGKEWDARLKPLRRPKSVSCPGMPQYITDIGVTIPGSTVMRYPAWDIMEGVVWCRWGSRPDPADIDSDLWEEGKLSEFHAALERHEEQRVAS